MSGIYRQTLHCRNTQCLEKVRVGRILKYPSTRVGAFTFCPLCGGKAAIETDNEETYWEVIADNWGMPVDLLKEIYSIWDRKEYQNLSDFVTHLRTKAKAAV